MEEKQEKKKSNLPLVMLVSVLAVTAVLLGFYFGMQKNVEDKAAAAVQIDTVAISVENLLGNYEVNFDGSDTTVSMTAYIDTDSLGFAALHLLSEYEPRVLSLEITPDGKVFNEELGEGYMSYKGFTDMTSITFQKDEKICILIKY